MGSTGPHVQLDGPKFSPLVCLEIVSLSIDHWTAIWTAIGPGITSRTHGSIRIGRLSFQVKLETLGHIRVLRYEDAAVFVM